MMPMVLPIETIPANCPQGRLKGIFDVVYVFDLVRVSI